MSAVQTPGPAAQTPGTPRRRHRTLVGVLLAVATITGLLAMFSVWVNRQALNTDNWTQTSTRLLADPRIQDALGAYLVDQVFSNVDVSGELSSVLPEQARALAGPAAAGLRELASRAAPELLARPRVQQAWRQANRAAHQELLRVIEGGGPVVSTRAGEVTLDVHALVDQLAASLGLSQQLAAARQKLAGGAGATVRGAAQQRLGVTLPPSAGRIVVLRSDQLEAAQTAAKAIRGLAYVMTGVSLLLFALAVALAGGWRRVALRTVGWCLVADGILVLLGRRVGGGRLVDALVPPGSVRPAAQSAWAIGTSLLYDIAVAMVVYGLVLVCAAWLAGSTRPAVALRRTLAPSLRYRVATVYAVAALLFGLLLLWGPTPATHKLAGILLFAVLIVAGLEALRRQTAHEFPEARPGDGLPWLRAHVREWRHPNGGSPRSAGGSPRSADAEAPRR